jgi:hypothetical protein
VTSLVECAAGLWLAVVTLRDVFETVVVPGHAHGSLKISRRLVFLVLPLYKARRRKGVGLNFAPSVLVAAFAIWMLLLVLAFGLMTHAFADAFEPPLRGFGHALYVAGGAMTTMGIGRSEPHGAAAVVAVGAGFCGLAVMTLAVTYLLEVQSNIAHRDTGVLKITTTSGQPPSALALLERYADLDTREELAEVLRHGREWCATVLQSHASHPTLIYFRSAGTGSGWPATLEALVDLSLILELLLEEPRLRGGAVLMREQGVRLARELVDVLRLEAAPVEGSPRDVDALCTRLAAAGYGVRAHPDPELFLQRRRELAAPVRALCAHLGTRAAPLVE